MKYKLGNQRPLDIQDFRAKKRPSIVGVLFVAPLLLVVVGLLAHAAMRVLEDPRIGLAIGVGLASLVLAWGAATILPSASTDRKS